MNDEAIGTQIVDCAMKVHTALGAGLLESAYEACLTHELSMCGLEIKTQVPMPVRYAGLQLDVGYRLDMIVGRRVIIEVRRQKNFCRCTQRNC